MRRRVAPLIGAVVVTASLAAAGYAALTSGDAATPAAMQPQVPGSARLLVPFGFERHDDGTTMWALGASGKTGELTVLRRRGPSEWGVAPAPVAAAGAPLGLLRPVGEPATQNIPLAAGAPQHAAEMAIDGHAAILAFNPADVTDVRLLERAPNGGFIADDAPPLEADERLVSAPDEDGARALLAVVGGDVAAAATFVVPTTDAGLARAVLRHDEAGWTREAIVGPPGGEIYPVGVGAVSRGQAWLLARSGQQTDAAPVLLHRETSGGVASWVVVPLDGDRFLDSAARPAELSEVRVTGAPADPLTVTDGGLWIDLQLKVGGDQHDATVHVRTPASGRPEVDGRWCAVPALCDHALALSFSTRAAVPGQTDGRGEHGYRSLAFPATDEAPFGQRLISAPVDADTPSSVRGFRIERQGGYAELTDTEFAFRDGIGEPGNTTTQALAADGHGAVLTGGDYAFGAYGPVTGTNVEAPVPTSDTIMDVALAPTDDDRGQAVAITRGLLTDQPLLVSAPGRGWTTPPTFVSVPEGPASQGGTAQAVAWPQPDRVLIVFNGGALVTVTASLEEPGNPDAPPITNTTTTTGPIGTPSTPGSKAALPGGEVEYLGTDVLPLDIGCDVGAEPLDCLISGADGYLWHITGEQEARERLPGAARTEDITSVAYVAGQPVVATAKGVYRRSADESWQRDDDLVAAMAAAGEPPAVRLLAATKDGGLIADGRWHREPGQAWQPSSAPLVLNPVALAAFRDDAGALRALVVASPDPVPPPKLAQTPPTRDAPFTPVLPDTAPDTGVLLREGADGWEDLDRASFQGGDNSDIPQGTSGFRALAVTEQGTGWAVGGIAAPDLEKGVPTVFSRGTTAWLQAGHHGDFPNIAGLRKFPGTLSLPGATAAVSPQKPGTVRLAIGGHPACQQRCGGSSGPPTAPDIALRAAAERLALLRGDGVGAGAYIVGGGRNARLTELPTDARRYRDLVAAAPAPSVIIPGPRELAATPVDVSGEALRDVLAGQPAPVGSAPPEAGITPIESPAPPARDPRTARSTFAFDVSQNESRVRVLVINNTTGRLAGGVNPARGQAQWIDASLEAAGAEGVPVVVIGNTPLDTNGGATPATDAEAEINLLAGRAAAYVAVGGSDDPAAKDFGGGLQASQAAVPGTDRRLPLYQSATLGYATSLPSFIDAVAGIGDDQSIAASILSRVTMPGLLLLDVDSRPGATPVVGASAEPLAGSIDLTTQRWITKGTAVFFGGSVFAEAQSKFRAPSDRTDAESESRVESSLGVGSIPLSQCFATCDADLPTNVSFNSSDPTVGVFVKVVSNGRGQPTIPTVNGSAILDSHSPVFCPLKEGSTAINMSVGGWATIRVVDVVAAPATPEPLPLVTGSVASAAATPGKSTKTIKETCAFDFGTPSPPAPAPEPPPAPAPQPPPAPEPVPPAPTPILVVPAIIKVPALTPLKPPVALVSPFSTIVQSAAQAAPVRSPLAAVSKPAAPPPPVPPGGGALQPAPIPATAQAPVQAPAAQAAVQLKDQRSNAVQHSDNAAVRYEHREPGLPWGGIGGAALMLVMAGGWTVGRGRRAAAGVAAEARDS